MNHDDTESRSGVFDAVFAKTMYLDSANIISLVISIWEGKGAYRSEQFSTYFQHILLIIENGIIYRGLKSLSESSYLDVLLSLLPPGYIGHDSRKVRMKWLYSCSKEKD